MDKSGKKRKTPSTPTKIPTRKSVLAELNNNNNNNIKKNEDIEEEEEDENIESSSPPPPPPTSTNKRSARVNKLISTSGVESSVKPPPQTTTTNTTTTPTKTQTPRTRSQISSTELAGELNFNPFDQVDSNKKQKTSPTKQPESPKPFSSRKKQAANNNNNNNSTPNNTTTTTTTTSTTPNSTPNSNSKLSKPITRKMSQQKLNEETTEQTPQTSVNSTPTTTTAPSLTSPNNNNNNNNNNNESSSSSSSTSPNENTTGVENFENTRQSLQGLMRNLSGALLDELQSPLRGSAGGSGLGGNPAAVGLLNTLIEGRNRSKLLLAGLKSDDETKQMESLLELCDLLSIATEETIAGFPSDSFSPALVNLLNMDHNPDIMLLAGRALSNMIEALPSCVSSVINHGAVSILCSKLLSIEYIDLAEQCLQTLEKISQEQPTVVLRAGGLTATLSYIDFFSTGVQRMAITTASNICRQVPQDCFELVRDSISILTDLLQYADQKVVELSCLCFSRLVDSFYDSSSKLEILTSKGLMPNLVRIISGMYSSTTSLSPNTYSQIIRIMATICHGCPNIVLSLLNEGIISIIQTIMYPPNENSSTAIRSNQQCYEILSLINEILPPLPTEFSSLLNPSRVAQFSSGGGGRSSSSSRRRELEAAAAAQATNNNTTTTTTTTTTPTEDPRITTFKEHPELLKSLGQGLFTVLVEMFTSNVNPSVRYKSLGSIFKILYYSSIESVRELLKEFAFSSFLASLLGSRDMAIVASALKIVELMMDRLPDIFDRYFKREGVVYEVDRLSKLLDNQPIVDTTTTTPIKSEDVTTTSTTTPTTTADSTTSPTTTTDSTNNTTETNNTTPTPTTPMQIPMSTPTRSIPPPLASSPFGVNTSFYVGSPIPNTPTNSLSSSMGQSPSIPHNLNNSINNNNNATAASTTSTISPPQTTTSTTTATTSSTNPVTPEEFKTYVVKEARKLKDKYFPKQQTMVGSTNENFSTKELSILKVLSSRLNKCEKEEQGIEILEEIKGLLEDTEGISAFEFLQSDLVGSILHYLTRGEHVVKHAKCFVKVFMVPYQRMSNYSTSTGMALKSSSPNPLLLSLLIEKLHDALNKVERFNISVSDVPGTSSGLKYLTQPFKLKLVKDGSSELLKDYSSNIVLIEPLANITAIEEFLNSKVIITPSTTPVVNSATNTSTDKQMLDSETSKTTSSTVATTTTNEKDSMLDDDEDDYHDYDDEDELLNNEQSEPEADTVHDVKINDSLNQSLNSSSNNTTTTTTTTTSPTTTTTNSNNTTATTTSPTTTTTPTTTATTTGTTQKLGIFVDGQRLSSSITIFQAVQKIARLQQQQLHTQQQQLQAHQQTISGITNPNNNNDYDSSSLNIPTNRLWDGTHTLKYRFLTAEEIDSPNLSSNNGSNSTVPIKDLGTSKLNNFLTSDENAFTLSTNDTTTYEIIALLRCLYMFSLDPNSINEIGGTSLNKSLFASNSQLTNERSLIGLNEFVSQKLTAKIMRQLQDPLALCGGVFPDWCKQLLNSCSFLFPFECKRLFFYSTSFGIARALSTLQQRQDLIRQTNGSSSSNNNIGQGQGGNGAGDFRVGRIQRQKVRIYRNKVLESAIKVMDLYGKSKSILEVEYFGEAGTGIGPTLEFFTLVSKELQRKDLNLWYTDNNDQVATADEDDKMKIDSPTTPTTTTPTVIEPVVEYIYSSGGLFPKPINPNTTIDKKILDNFKFLGMFVAKAFFDQRLIDLPLSKPFYKYMIDQELDFQDLVSLAPTYASSLSKLYSLVTSMRAINERSDISAQDKSKEIDQLTINGAKIEDLCLDFTLPGFPGWELKAGGENINVTLGNLEEYLNLIVSNFLYNGVIRQINAFKEGFNTTFSITSLGSFTISEVESLLCGALTGSDNDWSVDSLIDSTKADHGYTLSSKSVQNIFSIMSEFSPAERKQFLLFISGSPHLPLQGFKGLIPRLTIVKKHHVPPLSPDDYLLSVMSCTNYIKLPDYSTKEIMKEKLLYAMNEGQSSFHLS